MNKFNSWSYWNKFFNEKRLEYFCDKYIFEYDTDWDFAGGLVRPIPALVSIAVIVVLYTVG